MMLDLGLINLLSGIIAALAVLFLAVGIRIHKKHTHWLYVRQRAQQAESGHKWLSALQKEALAAGLEIPTTHIVFAGIAGVAIGVAVILAVTGKLFLAPLGAIFGIVAPVIWVKRRISGRSAAFEAQLEVVLGQMASAIRAGLSVQQALEQAALSAVSPAKEVLGQTLHLIRSGTTLTKAMEEAGQLVKSRDLKMVAAATGLHMQTGGDLAMIYDQIADGIRDRRNFRAQVGSATSEGRLTSNVLLAIPFIAIGGMRALSPEYMGPLFNTAKGLQILAICSGFIIFGWMMIKRIVKIEY
jgi:tight adherence protein B